MKTGNVNKVRGDAATPGDLIELINLRIIRPNFGIATVRLPAVHLLHLVVMKQVDGKLVIRAPRILSRNGKSDYGVAFAIQPGVREAVEAAIGVVWDRAEAAAEASSGA